MNTKYNTGLCPVCDEKTKFIYHPEKGKVKCTVCDEMFFWEEPMYPFAVDEKSDYDEDLDIGRAGELIADIIHDEKLNKSELQSLFSDFIEKIGKKRHLDVHLMKPRQRVVFLIDRIIKLGEYRRMSDVSILMHNIEAEAFGEYKRKYG